MSVTESNPDPAGTATPSTSPSPPSDEAVPAALSIYGQESPIEETPEVLATSHAALENELDKLPDEKKAGWLHAKEMCPELVNEEHRLMFLRCELFHAERAAIRIANYWNRRIELFGDNLAFKEIKLGDSGIYSKNTETNSDNESEHNEKDATIIKSTILGLSHGILRPTTTHDTGGRAIVFIDPSRLKNYNKHNEMERMGVARTFWCVLHSILENNDTAQKVGIVVLAYPHHLKLSYVDRKLMRMNMESLSGCIPVRLGALHVCHPPWFFAKIVFPIMKLVAGDRIRKRVRLHSGSEEKVLQDLEEFGLGKEVLPSELGGEVVLEE